MPSAPPTTPVSAGWNLEHSYAQLPSLFHFAIEPTPVGAPRLVILNRPLADFLGLDSDSLAGDEGAAIFAGNRLPPGAAPLAQAYAGHQYGHFTVLGDGRAILLGEQITPLGERFDIQLKGPDQRRFPVAEMVARRLVRCCVNTSSVKRCTAWAFPRHEASPSQPRERNVWRDGQKPGAVLTRVAASHIRVGTFEWAAARRDEGPCERWSIIRCVAIILLWQVRLNRRRRCLTQ